MEPAADARRKIRYCCQRGRSSPNSWISACCWSAVKLGSMYAASGFPGIRRKIRNKSVATTQSTSSIWARRCAIHLVEERVITAGAIARGPLGGAGGRARGRPRSRRRRGVGVTLPGDLQRLRLAGRIQEVALGVPLVPGLLQEVPGRGDVVRVLRQVRGVPELQGLAHWRGGQTALDRWVA